MADNDDFEIIDDAGLSIEPVFEFIDVNDMRDKNANNTKPKTPDTVLPFLISKPLVNEIPPVVQQQPTPAPIINPSESKEPSAPIKTTIIETHFVAVRKPVPPPSPPLTRNFAPVPLLSKPPAPQRFGDAALIPHNLNDTLDIDAVINRSRKTQQSALSITTQEQQDVKTQVISDNMATGSAFSNVLKAKEDLQKSHEQLEQEKRSVLSQRIPTLQLDGKTKQNLIEMAKEFHETLEQLHGAIYELSERFERQKYDMVELSERARQIEKGKAKTRKSNIVHTGLGGGIFAGVNDITAQAPPKVSLFSRYERLTDRRTYKDRRDVWATEKKSSEFVAERPKAKIKHIAPTTDDAVARKAKRAAAKQKSEEQTDDLPPPPAVEEEEEETPAPPEEAPAEEEPAAPEEQNEEEEEEYNQDQKNEHYIL